MRAVHAIDEVRDAQVSTGSTGRRPITLCGRLSVATHDLEKVTCGNCLRVIASMNEKVVELRLKESEIVLLEEALDSHEYWQLSEEEHRSSGYVMDEGVTPEIRSSRRLSRKLTRARGGPLGEE